MEKIQQIELKVFFGKLKESLEHQICLLPDIFKAIKSLAETAFANNVRMNVPLIDIKIIQMEDQKKLSCFALDHIKEQFELIRNLSLPKKSKIMEKCIYCIEKIFHALIQLLKE
jgi:hypothetical protein